MEQQLKELLVEIAATVLAIVAPMLVLYLKSIKTQLAKSLNLQLSAEEARAVDAAIEVGVRRAEEKARQLLGSVHALDGSEKQQIALEAARRVEPEALAKYDDDAARALIDAKVQSLRPSLKPPAPPAPRDSRAPGE